MTRKIKTEEVLAAYNVLGSAKYTKLEDAEKIAVWKIARALKPVAVEYKETKEDAETKLKPTKESTGYDYDEQMQKAVVFENLRRMPDADMTKAEMGPAEYGEFLKESTSYTKRVNDALREYAHKEVELEFEPIGEETFMRLMSSNAWNFEQAAILSELICE